MKFKYGKGIRTLELPPDAKIEKLEPRPFPAVNDVKEALTAALDSPIGSEPMRNFLAGKKNLTIVIPDRTRSAGTAEFLPHLLKYVKTWSNSSPEISILVATGMHTLGTEEQLDALVTPELRKKYKVIQHDANDKSAMIEVGKTTRGTPVAVNRLAHETDGIILTGSITFHYFAGFTGGRKAFLPGVASAETITANHKLTMQPAGNGISGTSMTGILDGNPVNEDMEEAIKFGKPSFLANTVLNADGRIAGFFCGDVIAAHREGAKKVVEIFAVKNRKKADAVIASCGGFPKDMNFIQAHKALHHAFGAVKDGGTLLLVAECGAGIGSETFLPYFDLPDSKAVREHLMKEYTLNGHTALATLEKAERCNIVLLSELDGSIVSKMRMQAASGSEEAVEKAVLSLADEPLIHVMPEAAMTFVTR